MIKWFMMAFVLAGTAISSPSVRAQSSDPGWLDSLRFQLQVDHSCEVQYFFSLRERQTTTGNTYTARVQCEDGRRFDVTRTDPETDFTVEACGNAVCQLKPEHTDQT